MAAGCGHGAVTLPPLFVRRRNVFAYLSVSLVFNELKTHQRTRQWKLKPRRMGEGYLHPS